MENIIIILILVAVVGSASAYIFKMRKKGIKCIGCPNACNGACHGCQGDKSGADEKL